MAFQVTYLMVQDELDLLKNQPAVQGLPLQLGAAVKLLTTMPTGPVEIEGVVAAISFGPHGPMYSVAYPIGPGIYAVVPHYVGSLVAKEPPKEEEKPVEEVKTERKGPNLKVVPIGSAVRQAMDMDSRGRG